MKLYFQLLTVYLLLCLSCFPLIISKVTNNNTDVSALLLFKSQISDDPLGVLSSWNGSLHHCQWHGVLCGRHHPDRVTALVLDSKKLSGYVSPSLANLTFLQNISLSDNNLGGSIPVELGYLGRLRFVNLSMNYFQGNIPPSLGNCSKLEVLSLMHNNLHGNIPSNIAQCKKLEMINLRYNFLTGSIPQEFGLFPQLQYLILSVNNLTGSIPSTLGNLGSLIYLCLNQNNFDGHIPDSLGNLTKLSKLYLYQNNLNGHIPESLGNLTKLSLLLLHQNNLNGCIPSILGNHTHLIGLLLYQNRLSGTIPSSFSNLQGLEALYLDQNRLSGFLPNELGKLRNLQYFNIYDNNISGEIPHSFYNITTLVQLELGNNSLEGTLPSNMCDSFPNLQTLRLYCNNLKGKIPSSISNCSALEELAVQNNYFSGTIPSNLGVLANLYRFLTYENQLEARRPSDWSFMDALVNCTMLQILDIGDNQLQGALPKSITNFSSIVLLRMSNNPIKGTIPKELRELTNIDKLQLDHMLLNGNIPEEIGNLFRLEFLDLSSNLISGQIPITVGNLTRLSRLYLNNNAFQGSIPPQFVNMQGLELLNLSNNKLIGKIPVEIMSLTSLSIGLDLSHNYLTNILPLEIANLKNLQSISLSNNKLSGELPKTIGGCQELQDLYLANNLFQGTIPSTLSNLRGLQILDVSNNSLSGQVPEFIGRMNLQFLNISFNNFEGELPREGIFKNVSGLDVRGNRKLCGGIPEIHFPSCISKSPTHNHHYLRKIVITSSIVGSFICLTIIGWLLVTCYSRRKPSNNQQSEITMKYELKHVSYNDLLSATKNFSPKNLIGSGTFGKVYKAVMRFENITTVAVKVLNLEVHGASKSFFSECEVLRNVRHRNLIKVLSSCSGINHQGNDFKALVYEFMPNSNLAEWLYPNTDRSFRSLNLIERLNIVIDVASALEYLHYHGSIPIVHCDLKPNNILLDDNMAAHVGDFGLARFLIRTDSILSQSMTSAGGIKGSIGYIPPEYGMGGRPSIGGDVYSFGILLLEMFTGMSPTDERLSDGLSLHKQVEMVFPEQVMDMVDNQLLSQIDLEGNMDASENFCDCLLSVIQCGLQCSKESPKERISIKDAAKMLDTSRTKLLMP